MFLIFWIIILLMLYFMYFIFFAGFGAIKIALFSLDKLLVFIGVCYYTHHNFSLKFSSGNAVYFWNILAALIAVVIYTILFTKIHRSFYLVGKVINLIISYISVMIVYSVLISIFTGSGSYLLPLLNNKVANNIVNYILIGIIAIFVWIKREESLELVDF